MFKGERHERILSALGELGSVETLELARALDVSVITIRRDLAELESIRCLRRVHGGAVPHSDGATETALSPTATTLRGQTFGIIVPAIAQYYSPVVAAVRQGARRLGMRGVLSVSNYKERDELEQFLRMADLDVSAVIVTPTTYAFEDAPILAAIREAPMPVVLLERGYTHGENAHLSDSVRTDHEAGTAEAVRHLVSTGRRRLGLVALSESTGPRMRQSFALECARLGVHGVDLLAEPGAEAIQGWQSDSSDSEVSKILDYIRELGLDGTIVNPDNRAIALTRVAQASGMRVPDDLAIVAYDDDVASMSEVPLTAVSPPKEELGRIAFELCARRVLEGAGSSRQHVTVLPELRVRDSTGPGRSGATRV